KVINLSLTEIAGFGINNTVENACNLAYQQGVLCIVAAGNSGQDKASGYKFGFNALLVTANDKDGNHVGFGQKADTHWGVSAPGLYNWSTWPTVDGKYKSISGTSMATPQAAGVAALVFAQHPDWGPGQVADRIWQTANPMGNPSVNGAGRVNAAAAVGAPSVAPSDPGTKGHRTGNTYSGPTGNGGNGSNGSSAGPGSNGSGSSGGATNGTLPPAGSTDDADLANIGNGDPAIGTQNASKSSKGSSNSVSKQQVLELIAAVLLAMSGLSTLSASRRRRRARYRV
ncbi:MAG: hypothetical protein QOG03_1717, partial [Actinomycetota bacterium]|nr:hypothetical protein [Actinomycetota bacterium]